jgi:hypothetical protein
MPPIANKSQFLFKLMKSQVQRKRSLSDILEVGVADTRTLMLQKGVTVKVDNGVLKEDFGGTPVTLLSGSVVDDDPRTTDTVLFTMDRETIYKVTESPGFDPNGGGLSGLTYDSQYRSEDGWRETTDGFLGIDASS